MTPGQTEQSTVHDSTQQVAAALRIAELEAELRATRRDYQSKLGELTQRSGAGGSRGADTGLYEMLLRLERARQEVHAQLRIEQEMTLRAEAERDAGAKVVVAAQTQCDALNAHIAVLTAERDTLAAELDASRRWAVVLDERARALETSLAWRLGRAILDVLMRVPGARLLARVARHRRA